MKLKEYVKQLNKILDENSENGELDVVYAIDDEGNGFNEVFCDATVGIFDSEGFTPVSKKSRKKPNAVCIN